MMDKYEGQSSITAPAEYAVAVVPSDTVALPWVSRALYIGTGCDVRAKVSKSEEPVLFKNLPSGSILDVRASKVLATGTNAQDIVSLG